MNRFSTVQAVTAVFALLLFVFASPSNAQVTGVNCYVTGSTYLDLGAINLFAGNTDDVLSVNYTCSANASSPGTGIAYVKMCINLATGSGGTTMAPRYMLANNDASGLTLAYNLFSDPARTTIIGKEGSSYAPLVVPLQIAVGNYFQTVSGISNLYIRVPSGQGGRISSPYTYYRSAFLGRAQSSLSYAWSPTTMPSSCSTGNVGVADLNIMIDAHIKQGCFISTATELDFGQSGGVISTVRDQTSSIVISCSGTSGWQIGLSNGQHYQSGTRNMSGPTGALIRYQLYRDPARTQIWGSTANTDTVSGTGQSSTSLTVYGRVPVQSSGAPGTYSDIITVTLTY